MPGTRGVFAGGNLGYHQKCYLLLRFILLLIFHVIVSISLFALGVGVGAVIENRRYRKNIYNVILELSNGLAVVRESVKTISSVVEDLDDEIVELTETQKIPIITNYRERRYTAEIMTYDPEDYED